MRILLPPEEYEAEVEEMARYNQTADELKKHLREDDIEYITILLKEERLLIYWLKTLNSKKITAKGN